MDCEILSIVYCLHNGLTDGVEVVIFTNRLRSPIQGAFVPVWYIRSSVNTRAWCGHED
jgi:hypothetical protein